MFLEEKKIGETPVKLEPWRQLLLDGADYMEKHGHCKGIFTDEQGRVCFYGALSKVEGDRLLSPLALSTGTKFMQYLGNPHWDAAVWNNDPKRSGKEVVAAMRMVARS